MLQNEFASEVSTMVIGTMGHVGIPGWDMPCPDLPCGSRFAGAVEGLTGAGGAVDGVEEGAEGTGDTGGWG
jgi:hypothetical protein